MFYNSFFDEVFDSLMRSTDFGYREAFPATNVITDDTGCTVELALAGYKKDQLGVEITDDNCIKITASNVKETENSTNKKYHNHRIKNTSFERIYTVPTEAYDLSGLKASFEDGILSVFVPKKEKQIPDKKVIMIE